jgi:hypothetical protein
MAREKLYTDISGVRIPFKAFCSRTKMSDDKILTKDMLGLLSLSPSRLSQRSCYELICDRTNGEGKKLIRIYGGGRNIDTFVCDNVIDTIIKVAHQSGLAKKQNEKRYVEIYDAA